MSEWWNALPSSPEDSAPQITLTSPSCRLKSTHWSPAHSSGQWRCTPVNPAIATQKRMGRMAARSTPHLGVGGAAAIPYGVHAVLASIRPEHVDEMRYHDCDDLSLQRANAESALFVTLKPGPVRAEGNAFQAPHIAISLFARGLLKQLVTRLYFAGEPLNEQDAILNAIPAERRGTVLAQRGADGTWRLDLRLQGEGETAFFEV